MCGTSDVEDQRSGWLLVRSGDGKGISNDMLKLQRLDGTTTVPVLLSEGKA